MQKIIIKIVGYYLNMMNVVSPKIGTKHTFFLFCYPMSAKISAKQKVYLDKGKYKTIDVTGDQIQLYKWGNGTRKVLMVHGWKSNSYRWKNYIDLLIRQDCTVYSLDFPAHGNSGGNQWNLIKGKETIKATIDHLGTMDTIISHSVGSFTTLFFKHEYPNLQPRKVVFLATAGKVLDFVLEMKRILGLSDKAYQNLRKKFVDFSGHQPEYYDIKNFTDHITSSALLIHDQGDPDTDVSYSITLEKLYPKAELMITQGLGHKLRNKEVIQKVVNYTTKDID